LPYCFDSKKRYKHSRTTSSLLPPLSLHRGLYWPTLVSANIVLVVLDEYNCSGYFSVCGRACDALLQLIKRGLIALVVAIIFVIVLMTRT